MTPSPIASDPIGFAILGTGMVADYHQAAILGNADLGARLIAVGHHDPTRFAALGEAFGVPCLSFEALLDHPDVDVLCICTPSGQHAEQAIAAARAGKHILVEKPMALTVADADRMIEACATAGVRLGVTLQNRVTPPFPKLHAAVQAGQLGELTLGLVSIPYFRGQSYYDQAAWRGTRLDDGGVLMNQGIHIVDLLCWFMGEPVEVEGFADTLHRQIEAEDTAVAVLRFANGALATIAATTTAGSGFPHRLELYGTRGGIQVEGSSIVRWQIAGEEQSVEEAPGVASGAGAGGDPRGSPPTGHTALFRDFIHALRDGRPPVVDGVEGRRGLAAVLAIYSAAHIL